MTVSAPGEGRRIRLTAKPASHDEQLLLVNDQPIVRVRSDQHWAPLLEGCLGHYAVYTRDDCMVFHAGTVLLEAKAVLMLGGKGSGKSTLALALARSGGQYCGDEHAFVRLADRKLEAFPKSVTLKEGSFSLFADKGTPYSDPIRGPIRYVRPPGAATPFTVADVSLVIVPTYTPAHPEPRTTKLSPHESALMFVQQSFGGVGRYPDALSCIAELANLPAYLIEYSAAADAVPVIQQLAQENHR